jgi:hypothetical protein
LTTANPFTVDLLQRLETPDGRELLRRVAELVQTLETWQVLERLRRETPAELCRAAVSLHEARQAAQGKFGAQAADMFFDSDALQMASASAVASHRAQRLGLGEPVADVACGIGGDCLALARRGPVVASDLDPARVWMTRRNAEVAGVAGQVVVARADAVAPPIRCQTLFADPARRSEAGRRVRRGSDYAPTLEQIMALRPGLTSLAVKVSPALDEAQMPSTVDEIEYVSWQGQCREAVLWFGPVASARRRATVIGGDSLLWNESSPPVVEVGPPGAFIYDPDPAVVRSHLVGLLAWQLEATLLCEQVAYLTSATETATPFARCFRVLAQVPFGVRRLRQRLDAEGWKPREILRRRFPVEPAELTRELRRVGKDNAHPVSLVCTRVAERPVVFICDPR